MNNPTTQPGFQIPQLPMRHPGKSTSPGSARRKTADALFGKRPRFSAQVSQRAQ
jgi:hypothetical protein